MSPRTPELSWVCINGHETDGREKPFLHLCPECGSPYVRELWAREGGGN